MMPLHRAKIWRTSVHSGLYDAQVCRPTAGWRRSALGVVYLRLIGGGTAAISMRFVSDHSLGGDTAMPRRLHVGFCHAFLYIWK